MRKTWITAHSGAENTPDNSLQFVEYTLQTNVDVLELDIRRRSEKDPTLVLSHDEAEELAPLLDEAFCMIASHPTMRINCDLKEGGLEQDVFAVARKYGLQSRIVFSGTVDPNCIACEDRDIVLMNAEELIENFYEKCKAAPEQIEPMMEQLCIKCNALSIKTVNLHEGIIWDRVLEILNRYHIRLSVWTVNEPQRQRYFLEKQVLNLTTRSVHSALQIREKLQKKLLYEQHFVWHPTDTAKDFPFSFSCPREVNKLRISFFYAPGKETSEEICLPRIEEALQLYYEKYPRELQSMEAKDFMPIKNLITLSLDHEGECIGNAHRWAPNQEHVITLDQASSGFVSPEVLEGEWTGMLHIHEVISPICEGTLRVEGE